MCLRQALNLAQPSGYRLAGAGDQGHLFRANGRSSNGRTTVSDTVYLGSSPSLPTISKAPLTATVKGVFLLQGDLRQHGLE